MKPVLVAVVAIAIGLVRFGAMRRPTDPPAAPAPVARCPAGARCLPELPWLDSRGVGHAQLAGRVVVVNFWATWCKPCEAEIPDFAEVARRYAGDVVVLGVLMDAPDPATLLNFMSDHDMTYPVIPATPDILEAFHAPANYPTTFIFDRAGVQRVWKVRPMTAAELSAAIEPLLRAPA